MKKAFIFIFGVLLFMVSCKNKEVDSEPVSPYQISLAEWSFHKALFAGEMTNLDFASKAKELGFTGIEYVSVFFKGKSEDMAYLDSLNATAKANGVQQVLIMIDGEGPLADLNDSIRNQAVENHKKWVKAAKYLGCHAIRVNAQGTGLPNEVRDAAVKGLSALGEYAKTEGINVIVENHGGLSSDGSWLSAVMAAIKMDNVGTLPDFGNFCLERDTSDSSICLVGYDKYKGMEEIMPYAKGVSAKSNNFDADGNEIDIDYPRMMKIIAKNGYKGFIGVEFEGKLISETEGIIATKKLLEKCFAMK